MFLPLLISLAHLHTVSATYVDLIKFREQCQVKYERADGWSGPYNVECTYISGDELNFATGTLQYLTSSIYAVVFWAPNQATIIKLNDTGLYGLTAYTGCINAVAPQHTGTDQTDRTWRVCQSGIPC